MFSSAPADEAGSAESVAFTSSAAYVDKSGAPALTGADFWAAEKAWQQAELAKPFKVTVSEPTTVSQTFTSYTTYLVKSSPLCEEGVRRRYSDFDWLRDLLVARYHGVCVPLPPEKRLVGNQSRGFIEERMQGLEQFMLLVLANPYLRADATLRMFLTQKGGAEFEQAKKAASSGVGADPASNPGLARWFGVLRQLPLPVDADQAVHELSAYTEELEARVTTALSAVTKLWESSRATADSLRSMRDALGDWHNSCATAASALSDTLSPLRVHTSTLSGKVKRAADAFSNMHDLAMFAPNEIQIFLMDGLVTEVHRLRSLKALLAVRESAQSAYSRAWVSQDKLHFQAKQWRDKGREDKAAALEPKIAEAVGLMKRMKERLDDVTKGVLHIEADRSSRVRSERFAAMTGQYAALCIASGVRTQELWTGFMQSMSLDQNAMVADAQATLTQQASLHTLDANPTRATALPLPTSAVDAAALTSTVDIAAGAGSSAFDGAGAAGGAGGVPVTSFASFTGGADGGIADL